MCSYAAAAHLLCELGEARELIDAMLAVQQLKVAAFRDQRLGLGGVAHMIDAKLAKLHKDGRAAAAVNTGGAVADAVAAGEPVADAAAADAAAADAAAADA